MTVQEMLDSYVASGREIGAQVAAYLDGELVIDAWAGSADVASGRAVTGDTLFHSFSTGKGVAAAVVAVLVERGVLDYAAPVVTYWPEFGDPRTTVGHVLSHSAGVPYLPLGLTPDVLFDHEAMATLLANAEAAWEPGTASGYHAWTYGVLVREIVQRATGRSLDQVLREELGESLYFSVPYDVEVATLYDGGWAAAFGGFVKARGLSAVAPDAVQPIADLANRRDYLAAGVAATATVSARAAARMYARLIGGDLVSAGTLAEAIRVRTEGPDRVFGHPIPKGCGFFLGGPEMGPTGFGMNGSGGSLAFADPAQRFSFAFTHNRLTFGEHDVAGALIEAAKAELGLG